MSVLVLGGGGFIGRAVVRLLRSRGRAVRVYDRHPRDAGVAPDDVDWIAGEVADRAALADALRGVHAVVHLASPASPAACEVDWKADVEAQVTATLRLVEAMEGARVRRLVFVSSGGTVYGADHRTPIAEDAPTAPISTYGINKLAVEQFLLHARAERRIDPVVLRVANAFGPGQRTDKGQGIVGTTMLRALANAPVQVWGDGHAVRDYVYVDDVADAARRALDYTGMHATINVGSGVGRSVRDVIDAIARVGGFDVRVDYAPARGLDVPYNVLDCARARDELGWTPSVAFEDGLRRTLAWYRARR